MQLKFISLGLFAAVIMTAVNADDTVGVKGNFVGVSDVLTNVANNAYIANLLNGATVGVASKKRSVPIKVATAIRRRAIARRSEDEADEEEADEEQADENETEADEEEEDENEAEADEEEADEDESSTWERRDLLGNGLPIVGDLLGGGDKPKNRDEYI